MASLRVKVCAVLTVLLLEIEYCLGFKEYYVIFLFLVKKCSILATLASDSTFVLSLHRALIEPQIDFFVRARRRRDRLPLLRPLRGEIIPFSLPKEWVTTSNFLGGGMSCGSYTISSGRS